MVWKRQRFSTSPIPVYSAASFKLFGCVIAPRPPKSLGMQTGSIPTFSSWCHQKKPADPARVWTGELHLSVGLGLSCSRRSSSGGEQASSVQERQTKGRAMPLLLLDVQPLCDIAKCSAVWQEPYTVQDGTNNPARVLSWSTHTLDYEGQDTSGKER